MSDKKITKTGKEGQILTRPTRRELLIVIGHLQDLIGHIGSRNHDGNPNRAAQVTAGLQAAHNLCILARHFDPPIVKSKSLWMKIQPKIGGEV